MARNQGGKRGRRGNRKSAGRGGRGIPQRMGGRGRGRGQQMRQTPKNHLGILNRFNGSLMASFLTGADLVNLSKAYPNFQYNKPKRPQKPIHGPESVEGGVAPTLEELNLEPAYAEEKKTDSQDEEESKQANSNKESVKDKKVTGDTVMSHADADTLLARLNTKRLYQRIRYKRKHVEGFEVKNAYAFNKSTGEIAVHEWFGLLEKYKENSKKRYELQLKQKEGECLEEEAPKQQYTFPSSCELLLFSPCPRAVAVLASYPRSGNSLLRTLYERITLRVTGSDMMGGLAKHDLVGEMATQTNCVQFVKTHFPERRGHPPFGVSRAVLLVRNPYDALESYFNLMMTGTHTTSVSDEQRKKHSQVFEEMAKKEILVWRDFHEYWLAQKIPLMVIRYEDLIRYTDKVISKVIQFTLEINNMQFFEERIDRAVREEQIGELGSYRPRSGGIGKSLSKYSPELLQSVNSGIVSTMTKFGYKEMLVPNPKEWKLEPMDEFGVFIPGAPDAKPLQINDPRTVQRVRGPKRHTNWKAVKRAMKTDEEKL